MKNKILLVIISIIYFLFYLGTKHDQQKTADKIKTNKIKLSAEQIQKKNIEINKQEEERKINLAKQYCDNRNKINSRYYPIPENNEGCEINNESNKTGANLTEDNCKIIIDCLSTYAKKYASVTTINVNSVVERKYWIGMNVMELMYSLGIPNKINKSDYGSGVNEQWIYYKDSYGASAYYIYVENSKVTSYQDF